MRRMPVVDEARISPVLRRTWLGDGITLVDRMRNIEKHKHSGASFTELLFIDIALSPFGMT